MWGWEGSVERAQSPPPAPTFLGCCSGEGPQPELLHAEASLRLQERSVSGGLAAGRIRELEGALQDWHPCPLRGPAQGQDCRPVGSCSFLLPSTPRAFPAQGSRQLPHVLMEAGVSMATLTSRAWSPGTLPPAPRAWFGSSPRPRGVGAAALSSLILATRGTQV